MVVLVVGVPNQKMSEAEYLQYLPHRDAEVDVAVGTLLIAALFAYLALGKLNRAPA